LKVVGIVSDEDEAKEIQYIAKVFVIGQRVRLIAQQIPIYKMLNNTLGEEHFK
jgi:hypothetical protein